MQDAFEPREKLPNTDSVRDADHPRVTNKFDIVETCDVVVSLVKIANATKVTMEDGKFSAIEVFNYMSAITSLPKALSGIQMVPAELSDLDDGEIKELISIVKEELDYADDAKVQKIIEWALKVILDIKGLIGAVIDG